MTSRLSIHGHKKVQGRTEFTMCQNIMERVENGERLYTVRGGTALCKQSYVTLRYCIQDK